MPIGKYVVLLFYPNDYSYVDPTEIIAFDKHLDAFAAVNTEVVGISLDSKYSHNRWREMDRALGGIADTKLPLLSDPLMYIAQSYGMASSAVADEVEADEAQAESAVVHRGTVIVNDKGIVVHKSVTDVQVGRSVEEVLRLVKAFRRSDSTGELCPANWRPGQRTVKPTQQGLKRYNESMYS
jgi:peroxiredoxin (alkyl hydroperoxide reductase subunit C)